MDDAGRLEKVVVDTSTKDATNGIEGNLDKVRRKNGSSEEVDVREKKGEQTLMNFPKREELLLRVVLALPNASRMGLVARMR